MHHMPIVWYNRWHAAERKEKLASRGQTDVFAEVARVWLMPLRINNIQIVRILPIAWRYCDLWLFKIILTFKYDHFEYAYYSFPRSCSSVLHTASVGITHRIACYWMFNIMIIWILAKCDNCRLYRKHISPKAMLDEMSVRLIINVL